MDYNKSTKEFYKKLKTKGMSSLMNKKRNNAYLKFLKSHLSKHQKILDLACGYGRLTVPLSKSGYNISGIDLSPNLIEDAKKFAKQNNVDARFRIGDMRNLPYTNDSFDRIICMWSSFNHILTTKDQIKTLNEMFRILKNDGIVIIDMPVFKPKKKEIREGLYFGRGHHFSKGVFNGFVNVDFIHNDKSLLKILNKSKIKDFKIKTENIGERRRFVLYIFK